MCGLSICELSMYRLSMFGSPRSVVIKMQFCHQIYGYNSSGAVHFRYREMLFVFIAIIITYIR